ncbi:unnamed protein product [Medioppia subpectinata]|uniref:Uncharacterized protein n=1 Tax=Medioppia subpectinata TaxID=1979941 RepID=A0A7R9KMZ0_9ACAR|nr:unnamed protein product [Medioppia subpectinata]CAG2106224.1 unnamed protein product [Medioppia subpectinata]
MMMIIIGRTESHKTLSIYQYNA